MLESKQFLNIPQNCCGYIDTKVVDYTIGTSGCFICTGIGMTIDGKHFVSHTTDVSTFEKMDNHVKNFFNGIVNNGNYLTIYFIGYIGDDVKKDPTINVAIQYAQKYYKGKIKIVDFTQGGLYNGTGVIILDKGDNNATFYSLSNDPYDHSQFDQDSVYIRDKLPECVVDYNGYNKSIRNPINSVQREKTFDMINLIEPYNDTKRIYELLESYEKKYMKYKSKYMHLKKNTIIYK